MVGAGYKYGEHRSSKVVSVTPEVVEGRIYIQEKCQILGKYFCDVMAQPFLLEDFEQDADCKIGQLTS